MYGGTGNQAYIDTDAAVGYLRNTRSTGQLVVTTPRQLTLQTTSSGYNIVVDSAGTIELLDDTNVGGNLTVAATKSLTLTGGNTASRPGSPTEGMVYFDSQTDQLLTYANGKWQADRTDAVLVAASNSSQNDKDAADYVADGNTGAAADGDQVQINAALTAGTGKEVVLLAGTYTVDASVSVPNNTSLSGVGSNTLLELAEINVDGNLIENTDTTTGTGVTIRDMKLDGRKDLNTAGIQTGIYMNKMGDDSGGSARTGATITGVYATSFTSNAIDLYQTGYNTLTGNTAKDNDASGFNLVSTRHSSLSGNVAATNGSDGFSVSSSTINTLAGNTALDNVGDGFYIYASGNNLNSNIAKGNDNGFNLFGGNNNILTDNKSESSDQYGMYLSNVSDSKLSNNKIYDGLYIDTSDSNTVEGNTITQGIYIVNSDSNIVIGNIITSGTDDNYAIDIADIDSDDTFLADNYFTSNGDNLVINDAGTGTVYAGQSKTKGGLETVFRQASLSAFQIQNATSSPIFNVDTTNGRVGIGVAAPSAALTVAQSSQGSQYGLLVTEGGQDRIKAYTGNSAKTYLDFYDNDAYIRQTASNGHLNIESGRYMNFNTIDNTYGGYAFKLQGTDTFNIGNAGEVVFKNYSNSAAAFQVQNASSVSLFNVDSTNNRLTIGTSDTTGVILVLDTKTSAGDPTGVDGAMYYNSSMARFRCYESGAWKNCTGANPTNGSTATQGVTAGTDTYLTASDLLLPTGGLQGPTSGATNGTKITWKVVMSKTAAGTAASTFTLRMGTNGTTADTSRCTFSTGTATAAADGATVYITAYATAGGASSTLNCSMSLTHQLPSTGFSDTPVVQTYSTATSADSTTSGTKMGLSFNAGTSSVITIQSVEVTSTNL